MPAAPLNKQGELESMESHLVVWELIDYNALVDGELRMRLGQRDRGECEWNKDDEQEDVYRGTDESKTFRSI